MKLIFIEGVSGVGKSTATIKLRDKLRNKGYSADGYLEGDINNPIDIYWYAYLSKFEYENILSAHHNFAYKIAINSIYAEDYALVRYQDFDTYNNPIKHFYSSELDEYFKAREVCYKTKNPVSFKVFTQIFINRWKIFFRANPPSAILLYSTGRF